MVVASEREHPAQRHSADEWAALEARVAELEAAVVFLARTQMGARGHAVRTALAILAKYGFPLKFHLMPGRRRGGAPLERG